MVTLDDSHMVWLVGWQTYLHDFWAQIAIGTLLSGIEAVMENSDSPYDALFGLTEGTAILP